MGRCYTIGKLYAYLGILIYMALHIENKIASYWNTASSSMPTHAPIRKAMSRDRFQQISAAFHIADRGKSTFLKVEYNKVFIIQKCLDLYDF